jgi:hypothetical protein
MPGVVLTCDAENQLGADTPAGAVDTPPADGAPVAAADDAMPPADDAMPPADDAMAPGDDAAPAGAAGAAPDVAELAALATPFKSTADKDYIPKNVPAGATPVQDLAGAVVDSATACAELCLKTAGCNMATWLLELKGGKNCYVKTVGAPCVVPPDAEALPGAYLLLAQTPGCTCPTSPVL